MLKDMLRKILLWLMVLVSVVVLYFNTSMYLNYAVSLKYEVEHPKIMNEDSKKLNEQGQRIQNILDFNRLVFVFAFLVLGSSVYFLVSKSK